jgi:outer membrane protein OmpA-like peptidoglycan-associated protein
MLFILALMGTNAQAQVNSVAYKMKNYTLFTNNSGANKPNDDFLQGVEIGYSHGLNKYLDLYVPVRLGVPLFKTGNQFLQGTWGFDPSLVGKYDNGGLVVPYASLGVSSENIAKTWNWGALMGGGLNFRLADQTFLNIGTGFRKSFTKQRNSWQHSLGLILPVGGAGLSAEPKMSAKEKALNAAAAARLQAEAAAKAQKEAAAKAAADQAEAVAQAEKAKMEAAAQAQAEKVRMEAEAKVKAEKEKTRLEVEARAQAEKAQLEAEARKKAAVTPPPTVVTTQSTTTTTTQAPVILTQKEQEVMTYAMQGVQFETGSAQLLKSSYSVLDNVVNVLKGNSQLRLSINGHTDKTGNEAANVKLSQQRANACMAYLVSKGISLSRLTAKGYGSSQPTSDNSTPEGRKMNRRVEFTSY